MGAGNRHHSILIPSALRSANVSAVIPAHGYNWILARIAVSAYTSAPVLTPQIDETWAADAADTPLMIGNDYTIVATGDWIVWFGRANAAATGNSLDDVVSRCPLLFAPKITIVFTGTGDATFDVEVVAGF